MKSIALLLFSLLGICASAQFTLSSDSLGYKEKVPDTTTVSPIGLSLAVDTTATKLTYWIHGLAGNSNSWNRIQETTEGITASVPNYPARNTEGYVADYSSEENRPMLGLASWVQDRMEIWRNGTPRRDTLSKSDDFIIAHSQGGIVARTIRHNHLKNPTRYPVQPNAIATFGTPHGGAYILNTTRPSNGDVQRWINQGCKALTAAELQELVNSKWWLDLLISPSTVRSFSSAACDGLNGIVLPVLINSIRKPVGQDYAIGADHLAMLNNTALTDTIKVVTFYGIEEEPVFWRLLNTMTHTTDTSISNNILFNDPFGLNNDDDFPAYINGLMNHYRNKQIFWEIQARRSVYPFNQKSKAKARTFRGARQWLLGANTNWKNFIGARKDSVYNENYLCYCGLGNPPYITETSLDCYTSCPPPWLTFPFRRPTLRERMNYFVYAVSNAQHIITEEPNDGVVPVSSQIDYPGARSIQMLNTNHMQERNSLESRNKLNDLFDGKHGKAFRLYRR